MIDIITVTHNSEKWIDGYFKSILCQEGIDLKSINIIIVDNASSDQTFISLASYKEKYEYEFSSITLIPSKKNLGFGKGNNLAASFAKGEALFFLNIDVWLKADNLSIIQTEVRNRASLTAAWELRQLPYEHSKYYDPETLETSWASAAGLVVLKDVFQKIGGFDPNLFMYCEDVDLSWRIRAEGAKIKYLPNCQFFHYTYQNLNEIKPIQYYYGIINNLFLRLKFGTAKDIFQALLILKRTFTQRGPFPKARQGLIKRLIPELFKFPRFIAWRWKNRHTLKKNSPQKFLHLNYEISRSGDFYYTCIPKLNALASILIRTYNRPNVLRRTLASLRNQTYKHFEIVIVEDGGNSARKMIESEFGDLRIRYFSIPKKGRCAAGNEALKRALGEYISFLDDDDYLFPDYLETMIGQFERNPDRQIINSLAFRHEVDTTSTSPYIYSVQRIELHNSPIFHLFTICSDNYYPIQSIMFKRKVYEELGGFDEALDYYEDWNLWIKYTCKHPMFSVLKACSIFKIPADRVIQQQREEAFHRNRKLALERQKDIELKLTPPILAELLKTY